MKAKPLKAEAREDGNLVYKPCDPKDATHVKLSCPGPYPYRIIPVVQPGQQKRPGSWSWNGSVDKPTLMPSILTHAREDQPCCHSFVQNGMIRFLRDSTHELAGETAELLEVGDDKGDDA